MFFWIAALALAAAAAALIARALARGSAEAERPDSDVQVYRDQLAEVDRDLSRGVLSDTEAERLRVEVSRRLLEADRLATARGTGNVAPRWATRTAMAGSALGLVGGAAALYLTIGAPGYPDLPLKRRIEMAETARAERPSQADAEAQMPARQAADDQVDPQFLDLMKKLRAAMEERPDDLRGQELLARNEARLGNYSAAAEAQAAVLRLRGDEATAEDYANLAEFLVAAAGGYVSPEAEHAVEAALTRQQDLPRARYYAGLLYAQTGRPDIAFRIWRALLEEGPEDAPWTGPIRARIDDLAARAGVAYTPPAAKGPSAADMQAAADMDPEQREQMIRGMVSGLAQRLADEGGPPSDWARLIGAYGVLGESDKARKIWREAREVFADDAGALQAVRDAADRAGVTQ